MSIQEHFRKIADAYDASPNLGELVYSYGTPEGLWEISPADLRAAANALDHADRCQFDIEIARGWSAYHLGSASWADEMLDACSMAWTLEDEQ